MPCAPPFHAARRGHFIPRRDHRTDDTPFIVGALVGLAGAAILSAIQEALHASD
jgi:hypothetical protein